MYVKYYRINSPRNNKEQENGCGDTHGAILLHTMDGTLVLIEYMSQLRRAINWLLRSHCCCHFRINNHNFKQSSAYRETDMRNKLNNYLRVMKKDEFRMLGRANFCIRICRRRCA
ncbi:GMP synthase [Striga asiatica]|uniref:GMP synthase n=1 Tax=Striga asiatica TaxID=4170 RepID=A0A5A7RHN5_STRAF|nr:GMP synthase [Striga asiatica]